MAIEMSGLLDPRCVGLELEQKKKPELIAELVELLNRGGRTTDPARLSAEIMEREKLSSTGIGNGIAIPHVLSSTVGGTSLAFGRKLDGARFDAVDNQPVSLFFLLVGPQGSHAEHLRILSKLARYLHDRTFCQALLDAANSDAVIEAFRRKEESGG